MNCQGNTLEKREDAAIQHGRELFNHSCNSWMLVHNSIENIEVASRKEPPCMYGIIYWNMWILLTTLPCISIVRCNNNLHVALYLCMPIARCKTKLKTYTLMWSGSAWWRLKPRLIYWPVQQSSRLINVMLKTQTAFLSPGTMWKTSRESDWHSTAGIQSLNCATAANYKPFCMTQSVLPLAESDLTKVLVFFTTSFECQWQFNSFPNDKF